MVVTSLKQQQTKQQRRKNKNQNKQFSATGEQCGSNAPKQLRAVARKQ
jgi:hypothetical protein